MQSFLLSIIAFIIAIGVLVTIHEFGHYAIPLGGYVKMLDEREGDVDASELDRAFNRKNVWARIAIVIAGPLANLILAVLVYWLIFIVGITGIAPIVGEPTAETPAAAAGFQSEEKIVQVNGKATPTWNTVYVGLLAGIVGGDGNVDITVNTKDGAELTRKLALDKELLNQDADVVGSIGLNRWWPDVDPIIGGIVAGGAAEASGLQPGDKVLSSDGTAIATWRQLVEIIRASADKTLNLIVLRGFYRSP